MDLYLAGVSGSIERVVKGEYGMEVYIAGTESRAKQLIEDAKGEDMDLYLADTYMCDYVCGSNRKTNLFTGVMILQSFYYCNDFTEQVILPSVSKFMLDSGAFTFHMKGRHVDWDEYIARYAEFINKHDINLFFELDIDNLVGYDKVLQMRRELERMTDKPCIPVWHKSRGKEAFIQMCKDYDYVAIGGIVSKEITKPEYKYFPWFIDTAHKYGAKIHGLGFTNLADLPKYHFDSVDSTSWTAGNKFGTIYQFNGKTLVKYDRPEGTRLSDARTVGLHNFTEWVKFQQYAKTHL